MNRAPRILSLSQYGADLAKGSAYSGALDRQRDYARSTRSYVVIVPGATDSVEVQEGALRVIPTTSAGLYGFSIDALEWATRLHAEEPFDMVMVDNPHVMGLLGLIVRRRLGIPLVVHSMADMPWNPHYDRERATNHLKQMLMRFVVRRADMIRVSTEKEVERLNANGIEAARIALVPFYIDQESFARSLNSTTVTRESHRILFVGRLGLQKDIGTLIRSMRIVLARVPDARLIIVGGGPERSRLESCARACGVIDFIDFLGAIPRERIAEEFVRASVFALPSLYEGTCMVIHEAALAALPIVSTMNAGALDFIRPGIHGELVRVRDHRAMGDMLTKILLDQTVRESMGRAAYERVPQHGRTAALALWDDLLARMAHSSPV